MRSLDSRSDWVETDDSTWDDIDAAIGEAYEEIMESVMSDNSPIGSIVMFAAETIPENWLWCNGQSLAESGYPDLFALIGTTYGSAGSGFFNLPQTGFRVILGIDDFDELGDFGGTADHTLTTAELPAHSHDVGVSSATGSGNRVARGTSTAAVLQPTGSIGSGSAHNNMPPYRRLAYIIKALP